MWQISITGSCFDYDHWGYLSGLSADVAAVQKCLIKSYGFVTTDII